ncbi:MAG: hypothetical protein WDN25_24660 [Acetobacteraceae bacterium]
MRYNILGWSNFRSAFRWSNARAIFAGSLADREQSELYTLYQRVDAAYRGSPYADPNGPLDFTAELVLDACHRVDLIPCAPLIDALRELVWQLLDSDPVFFWMPQASALDHPTIERGILLRRFLAAKERFLVSPPVYENIWREKVIGLIGVFLEELPAIAFDESETDHQSGFSVLLIDVCPRPAALIEYIMATMYDDDIVQAELFCGVRDQFEHNISAAMGMTRERALQSGRSPPTPTGVTGTPPRNIIPMFLGRTPYADLFHTELPFALPASARFEHIHILAGSGHGKTQTLQHLILSDLRSPEPPSMVIIDSQGDMLSKISRLALFEKLGDRLVIIDPRDVDYPPALNMFDVNMERISRYGAADREQILNGVVELYEYFFGSLLGAELTQKQALVFRYLARLMIQIRPPTYGR